MSVHRAGRPALRLLALVAALAAAPMAQAAGPTRVTFKVIGDDKPTADGLAACLKATFKAKAGYEAVDRPPAEELILYVNRDVNDRVNPKGVSVAVAHVSNAAAMFLAYKVLADPKTKTGDADMQDAAAALARMEGNLDHLNVAHMDVAGAAEIAELCQSVTAAFFQKVPPNVGK